MTKPAKIIAALQVELVAAIATKDAANEAMDADRFYAACERVRDIEAEIARLTKSAEAIRQSAHFASGDQQRAELAEAERIEGIVAELKAKLPKP
jgi:hypothetical protein